MRISTSMMFDNGTSNIVKAGYDLARASERMSSGKQRLSASDDPVAAARSIVLSAAISKYESDAGIAGQAESTLGAKEDFLSAMSDALLSAKEVLVEAGNGSLTTSDLSDLASSLSGIKENLRSLANSKMSDGTYAFSGYSDVEPFPNSSGPSPYAGDQGSNHLLFAGGVSVETGTPGNHLFGGEDILGALDDLATRLKNGDTSTLSTVSSLLDSSIDGNSSFLSSVGARRSQLDDIISVSQTSSLNLQKTLSANDDIDAVKAVSDMLAKKTIYEASLKSFSEISSLNLFSLL